MRQNKFPTALLVSPEEGLAKDVNIALRSFGLKKLTIAKDSAQLEASTKTHSYELILIDADALDQQERTAFLQKHRAREDIKKGFLVALARLTSRDDLFALKSEGFATVLIKPISIGMLEQALSELLERERTQPLDRDALVRVHALFLRGNTFEAERTLSIWLEKEPDSIEGLTLLALQQFKKQEFYRANTTISKVLKIQTNYLPALQMKTRICLRLGQLNEAFQSLTAEEKAVAMLEAKRVHEPIHMLTPGEQAEISFCEDFETREGITALLNNLALQLSKTGRPEDALALYKRALGPLENPDFRFVTLFNRARIYLNGKKRAEAKRDLREARELCPDELLERIDQLLALCDVEETPSAVTQLKNLKPRSGATIIPDLLSEPAGPKKQAKYKVFNKDEVLEMIFLGKMEESSVPPDSVAEWLQMKKKLMHILFLTELQLGDEGEGEGEQAAAQGTP